MGSYIKSYKKGSKVSPEVMKAAVKSLSTDIDEDAQRARLNAINVANRQQYSSTGAPMGMGGNQDDYQVQQLKDLGMYDRNSSIERPPDDPNRKGFFTYAMKIPLQKTNAIVNGNIPAAPPEKGGTGTGGGTKPSGGGTRPSGGTNRVTNPNLLRDTIDSNNKLIQESKAINDKAKNSGARTGQVRRTGRSDYGWEKFNGKEWVPYVNYPTTGTGQIEPTEGPTDFIGGVLPLLFRRGVAGVATQVGTEVAKVAGRGVAKQTVKSGTKEVVTRQAPTAFKRIGSGASQAAGNAGKTAGSAAGSAGKAAMDSGALRTAVEAIRTGILNARKAGNKAEVQRLMKELTDLRKSNPAAGIYKKGGYVMKMAWGGAAGPGDPKGKVYIRKNEDGDREEVLIGEDQNLYQKNKDGVYEKKDKRLYDSFMTVINGGDKQGWAMISDAASADVDSKKKPDPQLSVGSIAVGAPDNTGPDYDETLTMDMTGKIGGQEMKGYFPDVVAPKSAWTDTAPEYDESLTMDMTGKIGGQEMAGHFPSIHSWSPVGDGQSAPAAAATTTTNTDDDTNSGYDMNRVFGPYRDMLEQRLSEAERDALNAKKTYGDLAARTKARDFASAASGIFATNLQKRKEPRAFKRPRLMDERYRGLSPQQINQEAESATGAGVEAVKQMNRESGSMSSRLGSALISRLTEQQGQIRKGYVDQNRELERGKYNEYAEIQQYNVNEEARAKRVDIDNTNKAIAGTQNIVSKYLGEMNNADMANTSINRQIDLDLKEDVYTIGNQLLDVNIMELDYYQQQDVIDTKKKQIEAELKNPNLSDEEKAKLKKSQEDLDLLKQQTAKDALKPKK